MKGGGVGGFYSSDSDAAFDMKIDILRRFTPKYIVKTEKYFIQHYKRLVGGECVFNLVDIYVYLNQGNFWRYLCKQKTKNIKNPDEFVGAVLLVLMSITRLEGKRFKFTKKNIPKSFPIQLKRKIYDLLKKLYTDGKYFSSWIHEGWKNPMKRKKGIEKEMKMFK